MVEEPHDIVFVVPAAVESPADSEWMEVTMALTLVRGGSELVAVAPPRGEAAWKAIRMKMIEVIQTIRESAPTVKHKVVTKIPAAARECMPALVTGYKLRKGVEAAYPNAVVNEFIDTLRKYLDEDVAIEYSCARTNIFE
ncbi:unnamed protein product [Heligmosomoides polygyrus]|uniref:Macro domain-containing protein n=1 Tax=Heligmosomoides polygyrus TaxID=6339 RepID=A0A183FKI8_HELPZ|nr:unnamed protein product [Heligmosomoides polygyrus]